MPDKYTWHLWQLSQMPDDALQTIEIDSKERKWLHELLKSMSPERRLLPSGEPDPDDDWPRYVPDRILKKGGEALIVLARDKFERRNCVLKIALPSEPVEEIKVKEKPVEPKRGLLKKALYRIVYDQDAEKSKGKIKLYTNENVEHFRRGFMLQKQLHAAMIRKGCQQYGYIPDVYGFHEPPQLWFSQEYMPGEELLSWCGRHTDQEILTLFLKIVLFIEQCLHGFATVHSDIAPKNFLVVQDLPVLLDFGIAKCLKMDTITNPGSQLGTPLYASENQITDSRNRGCKDDLFSLGRAFWSMWNRGEPDFAQVVMEKGEDGRLIYDPSAIDQIFDITIFPLPCKYFYAKAIRGDYEDISDMRMDVEMALAEMTAKTKTCATPCRELQNLEIELQTLKAMLKTLGD